ncbi:hypothetical protein [Nocardioides litoris]|uniref:hypothetical protein n=1 Tax=Nocardioides litoris TaxID=1926648 RepID=UPI00112296FA|nr:hypothetical protein [Nocardioides litoris]
MTDVRRPAPLTVAAVLVALQGLVLVALAVLGLLDVAPGNLEVGLSLAVFFGAYGALLLFATVALLRVQGWVRGPVLLTQLLQLGIAWNARENPALAAPLAVAALAAIAAMLHPASVAALLGVREDEGDAAA